MISGIPTAMTVRARQKLKTPQAAQKFIEELETKLAGIVEKGITPKFDDFDISQNPIPLEQFQGLFNLFETTGVHVQRIRMFGCSTLDDDVMGLIGDWLTSVTPENAPHEMHLSDCAIGLGGFTAFMDAIDGNINEAFPTAGRGGQKCPLYVRLENNYIQPESVIQDKINEGLLVEYTKNSGPIRAPVSSAPDAKVKFVVQSKGRHQQRQGEPPAPQDAPAPKQVWDRYAEEQEMQKGGGKGKGYQAPQPWAPAWSQPQAAWPALPQWGGYQPQPYAYQAPAQAYRPQASLPKGASKGVVVPPNTNNQRSPAVAAQAQVRPQSAFNAFGAGAGQNGRAGKGAGQQITQNIQRAADRSRTPQPRAAQKVAPTGNGLPAGWEEHFSDEYGIPYFWNTATGESLWEKPSM